MFPGGPSGPCSFHSGCVPPMQQQNPEMSQLLSMMTGLMQNQQMQFQQLQNQQRLMFEMLSSSRPSGGCGAGSGPTGESSAGGIGCPAAASSSTSSTSPAPMSTSAFKRLDEKLIPQMPVCHPEKWSSRPQQVLDFRQWIDQLSSWLSTLSPDYFNEIDRVMSNKPLENRPGQVERSQRLFFLLKQVFGNSGKVSAVIRLCEAEAAPDRTQDGFELLQKLSAFKLC